MLLLLLLFYTVYYNLLLLFIIIMFQIADLQGWDKPQVQQTIARAMKYLEIKAAEDKKKIFEEVNNTMNNKEKLEKEEVVGREEQ